MYVLPEGYLLSGESDTLRETEVHEKAEEDGENGHREIPAATAVVDESLD